MQLPKFIIFFIFRLLDVTLDVASPTYANVHAKGTELCRCPREYVGSSCQVHII